MWRISIPEDTYDRLEAERRENETVADVLERLLDGHDLATYWGTWSDETAARARAAVELGRRRAVRDP